MWTSLFYWEILTVWYICQPSKEYFIHILLSKWTKIKIWIHVSDLEPTPGAWADTTALALGKSFDSLLLRLHNIDRRLTHSCPYIVFMNVVCNISTSSRPSLYQVEELLVAHPSPSSYYCFQPMVDACFVLIIFKRYTLNFCSVLFWWYNRGLILTFYLSKERACR